MEAIVELEKPLTITKALRPESYNGEYLFVETEEGQQWKARIEIIEKGAQYAVIVTVSQVDESGKALTANGVPMVSEPTTHSFTETEALADGFDPEDRIMRVVESRIKAARAQFAIKDKVTIIANKLTQPDAAQTLIEQETNNAPD